MLESLNHLFTAGKNLLAAIHEANIGLVVWLTGIAGVTVEPAIFTMIDIGLLFLLAFGIVKVFTSSMKHAAIIAGVLIAIVLLVPLL